MEQKAVEEKLWRLNEIRFNKDEFSKETNPVIKLKLVSDDFFLMIWVLSV